MKTIYLLGIMAITQSCSLLNEKAEITPLQNPLTNQTSTNTTPPPTPTTPSENTTPPNQQDTEIVGTTKFTYEERKNISYGSDELQKYDLYLPKITEGGAQTKVPVIVLFHGGNWSEGDKSFILPMVEYLKQKNLRCAIVNANYRLTFNPAVTYREQLADIQAIISKISSEASSLNIDPKFFLMGISAGGHLAMLYSYTSSNGAVKAVGGIVPPADLTTPDIRQGRMDADITKLIGKPFDGNLEEYKNASPYFQIKRNATPTIVFYGGKDTIVPSAQGTAFNSKLTELNVPHEYKFYQDQSHEWSVLPETLDFTISFIDKYL